MKYLPSLFMSAVALTGVSAHSRRDGHDHDHSHDFDIVKIQKFADVPEGALGPDLGEGGFRVQDFGKGAYMVTDNIYQAMFVVYGDDYGKGGVIVVDAPPTIGKNLLYAIGNTTDYPITHEVYSHAHSDHIGASFLYGDDITRVAHRETKNILELTPDDRRPLPDIVFDNEYVLKAGNQTLELAYKGVDHEAGNIYIYAPVQRVLMKVDIVFPGWVPFAYLAESAFIPGFVKAHDLILDYDFAYFVGGHLTRAGDRADVEAQREYVLDLKKAVDEAIDLSAEPPSDENPISFQQIFADSAEANPDNVWALFETYLEALARFAEKKVLPKWLGVLGGADVYTFENAYQMMWSERVDFGRLGPLDVAL